MKIKLPTAAGQGLYAKFKQWLLFKIKDWNRTQYC
jgi:hypothetical protein